MGRVENREDKARRIREAAAQLFVEKGFDGTSVAEVAERAGIAKGTVFLYAASKVDLLALVMEDRLHQTTAAALAGLGDGPLHLELARVFSGYFALYEPQPALARLFVRELAFATGRAAAIRDEIDRQLLGGLVAHVEARKARGTIASDAPAMVVATNAFALYLLALLAWLSGGVPERAAAEAYLLGSLELACRGLVSRAALVEGPPAPPAKARPRPKHPRPRRKKGKP